MGTTEVAITLPRPARSFGSGALRSLSGFAVVLALGTVLLMVPAATADGETTVVEALYTAVSAVCVTGHVIYDTQAHWSLMGEIVILVLIQVGGLGYMMGTTVILWAMGRQLGLRDRQLLRLYYGAPSLGETLSFARTIGLYTLAFEATGAIVLFGVFLGEGRGITESAWWAVFHSVSAFNNAGFHITGVDLVPYRDNPVVLVTVALLVIFGGLGAIPVLAFTRNWSWAPLPLDAKLIFLTTGVLLALGTAAYLILEWRNDETLGTVDPLYRPLLAFFQSAMPRTAGFSAIPVVELEDETKFLTIALMFIGGAAGSTAGGVKVGTFALLFFAILATFRGRDEATVLRRQIPERIIRQAIVIALSAIAVVFGFTFTLTLVSDEASFIDVMFDGVSALATVGLSTGPASRGSDLVHLVYIAAMLIGRFGPLALVLEMNRQRKRSTYRTPEDSIRLG